MSLSLQQVAELIGASLPEGASADCVIDGLAALSTATAGQVAFFTTQREREALRETQASAVILAAEDVADCPTVSLIVDNPRMAFSLLAQQFEAVPSSPPGVHPTAIVAESCQLGDGVSVGPYCVLDVGVVVGAGVVIGAGCVIGEGVQIGAGSRLWPNVTLAYRVTLGERCIVHSGAVIGSDGFGFAQNPTTGAWLKTPQLGSVVLGDEVEVGASTTIDRGALDDTVLARGVKLDNQIQVGHNVQIGEFTAIAGCVAIGGSTKIGRRCMIGGHTAITGHIEIGDGVVITGSTGVSKSLAEPGVYSSAMTAAPHKKWMRLQSYFKRLDEIVSRIKKLEQSL